MKAYLDSRTDNSPALFVVINTDGTSTNYVNVLEEWFRYYSKRLDFKVTPPTLRHTLAAHLVQKGMPFEGIKTLLGQLPEYIPSCLIMLIRKSMMIGRKITSFYMKMENCLKRGAFSKIVAVRTKRQI